MILVYHNQYLRMVAEGQARAGNARLCLQPATDAIPFLIFTC